MKSEHWLQILIGIVILGAIGFLLKNQFELKGTLSSVSTQVEATDNRVARIANTLPEVRVRVAWEEVNSPLAGFVAASIPQKGENGKWTTDVMLYDANSQQLNSFCASFNENQKDSLGYTVAGKVRTENPYDPSFYELARYSSKLKESVTIPVNINSTASFVLRKADIGEYTIYLKKLTGKDPKVENIGKIKNWKELADKLEDLGSGNRTSSVKTSE